MISVLSSSAVPTPNPQPQPPPGGSTTAPVGAPVAGPTPAPPPCTLVPGPTDPGLIPGGFATVGTIVGGPVGGFVGFSLATLGEAGGSCAPSDGGFSSSISSNGVTTTTTDPQGSTTQDSYDPTTNTITATVIAN